MYKVRFSVVHEGCMVNELSRTLPKVRLICPGGFILGAEGVQELIILDHPAEADTQAVLSYLKGRKGVTDARVVEKNAGNAYVLFTTTETPKTFCSQVVERNRGFKIGLEIQQGGLEVWNVGCSERAHAEKMLKEIATLGQLKDSSITEDSWSKILTGDQS